MEFRDWKLLDPINKNVAPNDQMFREGATQHYFYVGRSNLLAIFNILNARLTYPGGDTPIRSILDFGCGHGRVTRWLRAAFRDANIFVTDRDTAGVNWCVEQFDCIPAEPNLSSSTYDLIWLGSVFTHLPEQTAESLLQPLLAALRPNGVLAFTSQGRFSVERMQTFDWKRDSRTWMHYGLDRSLFEAVLSGYRETGYGFVEYPRQIDYGVCIAKPSWYADRILSHTEYMQIFFQEKGCDNHQDVNAFMRANLLNLEKGPLWSAPIP
jgi:SAM-dependent methyltransferase